MPSKGTRYKSGKRNVIIDEKFYNDFIEETSINIDYKTFRNIILESNKEIARTISESEEGFKLPESLGYIVVTKYQSRKKPIDWYNSVKFKKKIVLTNLHSYGYMYHIKWYKRGVANFGFRDAYRLEATRELKRTIAKNIKAGKVYHQWSNSDFLNNNKILKKLHKT